MTEKEEFVERLSNMFGFKSEVLRIIWDNQSNEEEEEGIDPKGYHTNLERDHIEYCCGELESQGNIILNLIEQYGNPQKINWLTMCPFCGSKLAFTGHSLTVVELSDKVLEKERKNG